MWTISAGIRGWLSWLPITLPGTQSARGVAHIILAVRDTGSRELTSYRSIILNVHAVK